MSAIPRSANSPVPETLEGIVSLHCRRVTSLTKAANLLLTGNLPTNDQEAGTLAYDLIDTAHALSKRAEIMADYAEADRGRSRPSEPDA